MIAPAVLIYLPLEGPPRVLLDVGNEAEEVRLADWLDVHPEYVDLIERALALTGEPA